MDPFAKKALTTGIVLIALILFSSAFVGFRQIEDGQAGVKIDFGKIQDQAVNTGWHFYCRLFTEIEVWNVKTTELKETASLPSSEGLISTLDVSIILNIPKDRVAMVRKTIGNNVVQMVVEPYVREAIRNVVSGYPVKALYSEESRKVIGVKIHEFLVEKLEPRGIVIQDVLLRDVRLPASFSESIETKLKAEQQALQKEFELIKAKKDAEIEVARAEGVAKANKILAASIDSNYLRYLWIQGLQSNDKQVVYVPTEGNLPILEAGRMLKSEASSK
jgi:regulator of protease activity HflC (stomatin/prohibitin superfamily)